MTKMVGRRMAIAGTLVAPMLARHGWAQSAYPGKQIRMVVPFAPAGTTDLLGRIAAQHLAEAWGPDGDRRQQERRRRQCRRRGRGPCAGRRLHAAARHGRYR